MGYVPRLNSWACHLSPQYYQADNPKAFRPPTRDYAREGFEEG
jgi:hypothetical protein